MIQAQALVDYEKFCCAKVALFVDIAKVSQSHALVDKHREAITRIANLFSARVLLVDQSRLQPEQILENEVADAWILLVSDGRNRALATKKNPQRINVDTATGWEGYAFKELVRQIIESTQIIEDVTSHYSRFVLPAESAPDPRPRPN